MTKYPKLPLFHNEVQLLSNHTRKTNCVGGEGQRNAARTVAQARWASIWREKYMCCPQRSVSSSPQGTTRLDHRSIEVERAPPILRVGLFCSWRNHSNNHRRKHVKQTNTRVWKLHAMGASDVTCSGCHWQDSQYACV